MRKLVIAMLACGGVALMSAPTFAAQPQTSESFCFDESGPAYCTPTKASRYDACSHLAIDRGERLGSRGFDRFVYECLTGTIGTEPGTQPH